MNVATLDNSELEQEITTNPISEFEELIPYPIKFQ